jgi:hypothetical protein
MKRVSYALGVAGLAPALGLMMAPAAADAATHFPARDSSAKTVSLNHLGARPAAENCIGTTKHDTEHSGLYVSFWSTRNSNGKQICIGTIRVHGAYTNAVVSVGIDNSYGINFCYQYKQVNGYDSAYFGCAKSFRYPLRVWAYSVTHGRYVDFSLY